MRITLSTGTPVTIEAITGPDLGPGPSLPEAIRFVTRKGGEIYDVWEFGDASKLTPYRRRYIRGIIVNSVRFALVTPAPLFTLPPIPWSELIRSAT